MHNKFMRRQRKAEMPIGMIIGIIIGIVILTLSVYAIVHYKSNLNNKISNVAGDSTVDDLVLMCNSQSDMDQQSAFCCEEKTLKTKTINQKITCEEFSKLDISNNRITNMNCEEVAC
jgi:hypothetical protein